MASRGTWIGLIVGAAVLAVVIWMIVRYIKLRDIFGDSGGAARAAVNVNAARARCRAAYEACRGPACEKNLVHCMTGAVKTPTVELGKWSCKDTCDNIICALSFAPADCEATCYCETCKDC